MRPADTLAALADDAERAGRQARRRPSPAAEVERERAPLSATSPAALSRLAAALLWTRR